MADELSRAISFANGYFALADGLVSDLEDHLAEDVVLDWFGETIEGRANVAAFMKHQKINSRHMFSEINPVTTIGYRKLPPQRRNYHSIGSTHENGNMVSLKDTEGHGNVGYKRKYFSDVVMVSEANSSKDSSPEDVQDMEVESELHTINEVSSMMPETKNDQDINVEDDLDLGRLQLNPEDSPSTKGVTPKRARKGGLRNSSEMTYDLSDFGKYFRRQSEMKPTNFKEIERKMMELKEKGTKACTESVKTELGQGDGPLPVETNSIKYIEACGVIEFSRFINMKQIRKEIRKRYCQLQIAYSIKDENSNSVDAKTKSMHDAESDKFMELDENTESIARRQSKLMSLDEIRELSSKLVPHVDQIKEYEDDQDHCGERNKFLECLELQMVDEEANINTLMTPKYVRHQLTFDRSPKKLLEGSGDVRGFLFNYVIHMIIYESNTKCRLNLSHEFEENDVSDDIDDTN